MLCMCVCRACICLPRVVDTHRDMLARSPQLEREEAQLREMQRSLSVKEQLGRLIVKKNMKIADIVIKWYEDDDDDLQ